MPWLLLAILHGQRICYNDKHIHSIQATSSGALVLVAPGRLNRPTHAYLTFFSFLLPFLRLCATCWVYDRISMAKSIL